MAATTSAEAMRVAAAVSGAKRGRPEKAVGHEVLLMADKTWDGALGTIPIQEASLEYLLNEEGKLEGDVRKTLHRQGG